jgi:integrase
MRLTDRIVDALPLPAQGNQRYPDEELKGFCAVITAAGARSFALRYYVGRRERLHTIGSRPAWTTAAARQQAARLRRLVDTGTDPRAERDAERARSSERFTDRAKEFLEHGRKRGGAELRPATKEQYVHALMTLAAPLHDRPLAEIKRADITTLIRAIAKERGETMAARTRSAIARLYTWSIASGYVEASPTLGTETYATGRRARVLSDAELRKLWEATAEPTPFHGIVRILTWTGCRRAEAGGMRWAEIENGRWLIPAERTKNAKPLLLPLARQTVALIEAWPQRGDLLFSSAPRGFRSWSANKVRLDAALRFNTGWSLHDLRRTVETRMAEIGILKDHANRVLGHAVHGITQRYDHHDYAAEKGRALQLWADRLEQIVTGGGGEVVQLRARA